MSVESVLSCLDFGPDKRIFVSRHVKEFFPGVYARRERRGSCKQTYYVNLAMKYQIRQISLSIDQDNNSVLSGMLQCSI